MPKKSYRIILPILVLLIFFLVYSNKHNPKIAKLTKSILGVNISPKNVTSSFNMSTIHRFGAIKEAIVLCGSEGIRAVNSNGQEEWYTDFSTSTPLMATSRSFVLVAERNGRQAQLIRGGETLVSISSNENILTISVNDSGYSAITTDSAGYRGNVSVYSPTGENLFSWHSGERNIIDAKISSDNKRIAISTINFANNRTDGEILMFNLNQASPFAGYLSENNVFINLKYNNDGSLLAIGEYHTMLFSQKLTLVWTIDYKERTLMAYSTRSNEILALAFGQLQGENALAGPSVIESYGHNGKLRGGYELDEKLKFLDAVGNSIIANSGREVVLLNSNAKKIGQTAANRDIRDAALFDNRQNVLVFSGNNSDILAFE